MANLWLRLWHEMPTDPKWRTIARHSGQRIGDVIGVYLHLLVRASKSEIRGTINGISHEDLASALDIDVDQVNAIMSAMEGRVISGSELKGWAARQPLREEGSEGGRSAGDNYIYFVGTTENDVVKVGVSKNPWARVKDMQTGSAGKLQVLATIKTPNRSEKELHEYFKTTRMGGEWFYRSIALNSLIDKIKNKSISEYSQCIEYLKSLPVDNYESICSYVATTKDKEEDKDKEEETTTSSSSDDSLACPVGSLINLYHECMPMNPQVKVLNEARKKAIRQRWKEAAAMGCKPFGYSTKADGLEAWRQFFVICAESEFLTGRAPGQHGKPPFVADIDFLFSPSGFAKTLENKYHREAA